ncbi:MAG: SAM-dependent chlorinase/fluorinase, partial [Planctomycetales bacterium]
IGNRHYLAPDNGLLDGLARLTTPDKIIACTNPQFWRPDVSATFHGRDIMAPVAAHLSLGIEPEQLGKVLPKLTALNWPEVTVLPGKLAGSVQSIDSFGNLITDITAEMLGDVPRDDSVTITCDDHQTQGIFATYGEQPEMTLIALVGSSNCLELAIVGDNAKIMLGVAVSTPVEVAW